MPKHDFYTVAGWSRNGFIFEFPDCDDFREMLERGGYHPERSLFIGGQGSFLVEVYSSNRAGDNTPAYLVNIWVGDQGHFVFVPHVEDLVSLLTMLAPVTQAAFQAETELERAQHTIDHQRFHNTCFYCRAEAHGSRGGR